jgi:large subunit ribosomal protein L25
MANKHTLQVEKRDIVGKKIGAIRKTGRIPGNIYGKGIESVAVWIDEKTLKTLLKEVSESVLIEVTIKGDKGTRPVILREVTHDPYRPITHHVNLQQVNLKEKIQIAIPIEIIGEAPGVGVGEGKGVLQTLLSEIEVEALPTDLPEAIEVDVSALVQTGDKIHVSDLKVPRGVEIITDGEEVVVSITEPQQEEVEEAPASESDQIASVETIEEGEKTEEKE